MIILERHKAIAYENIIIRNKFWGVDIKSAIAIQNKLVKRKTLIIKIQKDIYNQGTYLTIYLPDAHFGTTYGAYTHVQKMVKPKIYNR